MNVIFLYLYDLALLFPLIQIVLVFYTYTSYIDCSATSVWFWWTYWTGETSDGEWWSRVQIVSCSNYKAAI